MPERSGRRPGPIFFLRTAERILLKVGSFRAETFEELFERTREIPWEDYIPEDGKFWVAKAASVKAGCSAVRYPVYYEESHGRRLKSRYRIEWFPESGAAYPVRVFLMKDIVTVGIDTTGISLHKRGYRPAAGKAPIAENLASGAHYAGRRGGETASWWIHSAAAGHFRSRRR